MKLNYLFIAILGLSMISCEKDKYVTPIDDIIYNDITPDKEIQTVRFFTLQDHGICRVDVPTPSDSSVTYDLDLDNNQISDFRIKVTHLKYTLGHCGHCDRFTYTIYIEGLSSNDSIAKSTNNESIMNHWPLKLFNESDTIDNKNIWQSRAQILLLEGCALPFNADFTSGYIGIKINKSYGYIQIEKIDKYGIRILAHGFNKTENNIITCGQTE